MALPQARYGVAYAFEIPIIKAGSDDFAVAADWTPAAGDVKISKDGGAFSNITTLPTALSSHWAFSLSATEMEAKRIVVQVVDSGPKAVKDQSIPVNTLPVGAITTGKCQSGSTTTAQLAAAEDFTSDNIPNGAIFEAHGGTGRGQSAGISGYTNSTDTAALDATLTTAIASTTYYTIWPAPRASAAATNMATAFASTLAEESAVPAANAPLWTKLNWLFAKGRNKITTTGSTQTIRNDGDSASIGASTLSDDGTTNTRGKFA